MATHEPRSADSKSDHSPDVVALDCFSDSVHYPLWPERSGLKKGRIDETLLYERPTTVSPREKTDSDTVEIYILDEETEDQKTKPPIPSSSHCEEDNDDDNSSLSTHFSLVQTLEEDKTQFRKASLRQQTEKKIEEHSLLNARNLTSHPDTTLTSSFRRRHRSSSPRAEIGVSLNKSNPEPMQIIGHPKPYSKLLPRAKTSPALPGSRNQQAQEAGEDYRSQLIQAKQDLEQERKSSKENRKFILRIYKEVKILHGELARIVTENKTLKEHLEKCEAVRHDLSNEVERYFKPHKTRGSAKLQQNKLFPPTEIGVDHPHQVSVLEELTLCSSNKSAKMSVSLKEIKNLEMSREQVKKSRSTSRVPESSDPNIEGIVEWFEQVTELRKAKDRMEAENQVLIDKLKHDFAELETAHHAAVQRFILEKMQMQDSHSRALKNLEAENLELKIAIQKFTSVDAQHSELDKDNKHLRRKLKEKENRIKYLQSKLKTEVDEIVMKKERELIQIKKERDEYARRTHELKGKHDALYDVFKDMNKDEYEVEYYMVERKKLQQRITELERTLRLVSMGQQPNQLNIAPSVTSSGARHLTVRDEAIIKSIQFSEDEEGDNTSCEDEGVDNDHLSVVSGALSYISAAHTENFSLPSEAPIDADYLSRKSLSRVDAVRSFTGSKNDMKTLMMKHQYRMVGNPGLPSRRNLA